MPRPVTLLGAVLLVLAIVLYAGVVGTLATMKNSDPAGRGLAEAYAVVMTSGLWILLAALSLIAGIKGQVPRWAAAAALILVPASGAAAIAAVALLADRFYRSTWPIIVPALAPLLILGFDLWLSVATLRRTIPAMAAGSVAWGIVLILSIAPWPALVYRTRHRATDVATFEADWKADEPKRRAEERQRNLAAFRELTPESGLSEWLAFRLPENELREQALEGIRNLPRRQADAEQMMRRGLDYFWADVHQLDLVATPVVCQRARVFLRERARDIQPPHPADPPRFSNMVERVEPYLATMQWLVDHDCDCDAELAAIEATVRVYRDSPERSRVLAALARIRQPR